MKNESKLMNKPTSFSQCFCRFYKRGFFCLFFLHVVFFSFSQDSTSTTVKDSTCTDRQKDLPDILRQWMKKPPKPPKISTGSLLLVPVISSNPANGFLFGAAGQYAFKTK